MKKLMKFSALVFLTLISTYDASADSWVERKIAPNISQDRANRPYRGPYPAASDQDQDGTLDRDEGTDSEGSCVTRPGPVDLYGCPEEHCVIPIDLRYPGDGAASGGVWMSQYLIVEKRRLEFSPTDGQFREFKAGGRTFVASVINQSSGTVLITPLAENRRVFGGGDRVNVNLSECRDLSYRGTQLVDSLDDAVRNIDL